MKNWTIAKRLVWGFGAVVTITAGLGVFQVTTLSTLGRLSKGITQDAIPGSAKISEMLTIVLKQQALLMEHAATTDAARQSSVEKQIADFREAVDKSVADYEKTIFTEEDRKLFEVLKQTRVSYTEARTAQIAFSRAHDAKDTLAYFDKNFKPKQDAYIHAIQDEVDMNRKQADDYGDEIAAKVTSGSLWTATGGVGAIVLAVLVGWFIISFTNKALRTSVRELTDGAQQVVSAAGQVSTSAQSLSQGATEQAASLEETSASMEEMSSMTRKNAESSQTAAGLMTEVDTRVRDANHALGDMVTSMASIQESSQKVAKIIKTIDEIAFQTNILALNAAVEAARAGEAGMGFAVVADEVRSLAQRSAQAAKDTASLIEESIVKAQSGNTKVEQVAGSISAITESVSKVKGMVEEVSVASRQQSQGIDQVSQAIAQMEKVTQTTAATAEESAAASEELNAQAEASMGVVARLQALVGGSGAKKPAQPIRQAGKKAANVVHMPKAANF